MFRFLGFLFCKLISDSFEDADEVDYSEEEDEEDWESADDGLQSNMHKEDLGFITFNCLKNGDLVSNVIVGEEDPFSLPIQIPCKNQILEQKNTRLNEQTICEEATEDTDSTTTSYDQYDHCHKTPLQDSSEQESDDKESMDNSETCEEISIDEKTDNINVEKDLLDEDVEYFSFTPPKFEGKNERPLENHEEDDKEACEESFTIGSTSKGSSEWRTSTHEEDVFSSSRRSCPTWESYTAYQKYDEEMTFYDQISAQKLHETKLLNEVEVLPRSISQKIVEKITKRNKKPYSEFQRNPYRELETAYVAQICLAWEALSSNYMNFLQILALQNDEYHGYPAHIAQNFQQFQVLLQRFIENEPYEYGRRPEIYARIRVSSPKLLLVPELRGIDTKENDENEGWITNISSIKFLGIMEDGIRTFMDFLKGDREKHCQILKAFIRRNNRSSLVDMLKKANKKKKKKIKDMSRVRKCLRKPRPRDEEMETLMGLIDLKVVSRVLKMSAINEEQLQWCEAKMSKVRFWEGKLQRDSSPLFFPAHPLF
ncbi:hypothetical protein ACHQM5_009202 [Ranunculus cassubicifolius]